MQTQGLGLLKSYLEPKPSLSMETTSTVKVPIETADTIRIQLSIILKNTDAMIAMVINEIESAP